MNQRCVQINIKGKVQGVFFRKYTRIAANNLGIKGFVRNEPDTSVYIEASGDNEALEKFIQWCHKGPESAEVEKVTVQEVSLKKFSSFDITFFSLTCPILFPDFGHLLNNFIQI